MSKIKENVYGSQFEWLNLFNLTKGQLKSPYFYDNSDGTKQTLYQAVINNKILPSSDNIDNSISPWGINGNAMMCNMKAVVNYLDGDTFKEGILPFSLTENESCPIVLYNNRGASFSSYSEIRPAYAWDIRNTVNNEPYNITVPITSFNYNNIIMACFLRVLKEEELETYASGVGNGTLVELDKYFDTENEINFETHPIILGGAGNFYIYRDSDDTPYINKVTTQGYTNAYPSLAFSPYSFFRDMTFTNTGTYKTAFNRITSFPYGYNVNATGEYSNSNSISVFGNVRCIINSSLIGNSPEETFSRSTQNTSYAYYGMINDNAEFITVKPGNYFTVAYWKYGDDITQEEIYREFAYMGFWFTGTKNSALNSAIGLDCTDPLCNIPTFDDNGITTGLYKSGILASLEPNAQWNDPHIDNPYDPNSTNQNDLDDDIRSELSILLDRNQNMYSFANVDEYLKMISFVNQQVDYTEATSQNAWYGIDPADFIYHISAYPIDIVHAGSLKDIYIGRVNSNIQGYPIQSTLLLDLGTIRLPYYYNDFRDYEPYSKYTIYLPFIGTYNIDSNIFLGHSISVQYIIDLYTNSAKCVIYRDDFVYDTKSASFGYSLPVTAREQGSYINTITTARSNLTSNAWKTAVEAGIAAGTVAVMAGTGNELGAVIAGASSVGTITNDIYNIANSAYAIKNIVQKPVELSSAGGADSIVSDLYARIIITHHHNIESDLTTYGKTLGFACVLTGQLAEFHGYTVCSSVRLANINMLPSELTMIKQFLMTGVVLP